MLRAWERGRSGWAKPEVVRASSPGLSRLKLPMPIGESRLASAPSLQLGFSTRRCTMVAPLRDPGLGGQRPSRGLPSSGTERDEATIGEPSGPEDRHAVPPSGDNPGDTISYDLGDVVAKDVSSVRDPHAATVVSEAGPGQDALAV